MAQKTATIIYNPRSGRPRSRAEALDEMARLLNARDIAVESRPTTGPNHASSLAEEAVRAGVDVVISYGGDGTLNEVIQGMIGSNTALAIWPGGTANVAAHDLKLPSRLDSLAKIISDAKTTRISVGVAKRVDSASSAPRDDATPGDEAIAGDEATASECGPVPRRRYFFMFAGIGLDAAICRGVDPGLKKLSGQFAFWASGFKHLLMWKAEPFDIDIDGKRYESGFALIGKGKSYGGGLPLTPHARLEDPWFEVLIVPPHRNNLRYVSSLVDCFYGDATRGGMARVTGEVIKANSSLRPWVELDGELAGPLPRDFEVVRDALSVVVP